MGEAINTSPLLQKKATLDGTLVLLGNDSFSQASLLDEETVERIAGSAQTCNISLNCISLTLVTSRVTIEVGLTDCHTGATARVSTQFLVVPKLPAGATVAWKWALEQGIQMTAAEPETVHLRGLRVRRADSAPSVISTRRWFALAKRVDNSAAGELPVGELLDAAAEAALH
jgi:hypothetical protein